MRNTGKHETASVVFFLDSCIPDCFEPLNRGQPHGPRLPYQAARCLPWPGRRAPRPATQPEGVSMIVSRRIALILLSAGAVLAGPWVTRADDKPNTAVKPADRKDKGWVKLHESFLERAKKGDVDVLFLGDSITQGWGGPQAKEVWEKSFAALKPANFGIGGDQTQHVLWRITEGKELEGIQPKAVVLMIGTNNMGGHSAEQIAEGVTAIVKELNAQRPKAKVLLLGIFPRSPKPTDAVR